MCALFLDGVVPRDTVKIVPGGDPSSGRAGDADTNYPYGRASILIAFHIGAEREMKHLKGNGDKVPQGVCS